VRLRKRLNDANNTSGMPLIHTDELYTLIHSEAGSISSLTYDAPLLPARSLAARGAVRSYRGVVVES
jgi:hypothetical protein